MPTLSFMTMSHMYRPLCTTNPLVHLDMTEKQLFVTEIVPII